MLKLNVDNNMEFLDHSKSHRSTYTDRSRQVNTELHCHDVVEVAYRKVVETAPVCGQWSNVEGIYPSIKIPFQASLKT